MHKSSLPEITITYNEFTESLFGDLPGMCNFSMHAVSGGSRGHYPKPKKSPSIPNLNLRDVPNLYLWNQAHWPSSYLANTPTRDPKDALHPYLQRGGPLPAGHYHCEYEQHHDGFGDDVIQLVEQPDALFIQNPYVYGPFRTGRDVGSFLIHGHGNKGSDGCIVPDDDATRVKLARAIRDYCKSGGTVTLFVRHARYQFSSPAMTFITD